MTTRLITGSGDAQVRYQVQYWWCPACELGSQDLLRRDVFLTQRLAGRLVEAPQRIDRGLRPAQWARLCDGCGGAPVARQVHLDLEIFGPKSTRRKHAALGLCDACLSRLPVSGLAQRLSTPRIYPATRSASNRTWLPGKGCAEHSNP